MARKKSGKRKKSSNSALPASTAVGLFLLLTFVHNYPTISVVAGLVVALSGISFLVFRYRRRRAARVLRAEQDRHIVITDGMSGRDFEQWTARLLERSGCTAVRVVGGAGDGGADVVAHSPTGRRLVVQCKRYNPSTSKVGSAEVQRFAGTARIVHGADIALMVTTTTYTRPAADMARRAGIVAVDRSLLAEWARTGIAPPVTGLHAHPAA